MIAITKNCQCKRQCIPKNIIFKLKAEQNKEFIKFKEDVEFLATGMRTYYEFVLSRKLENPQQVNDLSKVYYQFTDVLARMVRKNDMLTAYQRPSSSTVISDFNKCIQQIKKIGSDYTLRARSILLV